MSAITVKGVVAGYGDGDVLDGVDLHTPDGSVTAVLGPSGCGKSTLLRVIAGFLRPSAGSVQIGDRTVVGPGTFIAPEHRNVAIVPQDGLLFPHLDVAGNIGFALPRKGRAQRVDELLDLIGLPGMQKARPHDLSGGMQQRVAVARALAPRPDVVLLDEPFSALDVGLRSQVRAEVLRALRASGATAVLVTHDQDEALSCADQVAVLREGKVIQAGPPRAVYEQPADRLTAEFFGDCNVLHAAPREDGSYECALGRIAGAVTFDATSGSLLLRPEHVRATASVGAPATVADMSYHGHDILLHIRLGDGSLVKSRMLAGSDVPRVGDDVALEIVGT